MITENLVKLNNIYNMQDLFSKVNSEKRHLYGENGILGHRRAISTTIPSKNANTSSGHRRTYSNTSSDFQVIFSASPNLLKHIENPEPIPEIKENKSHNFLGFLDSVMSYFTENKLPKKLDRLNNKIAQELKYTSESIANLQDEQLRLINDRAEVKLKIQQELENKKKSDIFLNNLKKKTNELEISLKTTQEQLKIEKEIAGDLMNAIQIRKKDQDRNVYASLQISTNEEFTTSKKKTRNNYSEKPQHFPLTPS